MTIRLLILGLVFAALSPNAGRADVAAPDECTMPGQPCTNTDSNRGDVGKRGICMPDTCTRSNPGPDAGGRLTREDDCFRCMETTGGENAATDDDCSVAPHGEGSSFALIALALAALAARRR